MGLASNPSPTEGNSSHRSLYRASSLAPTEVDPVTATSNLSTPFLGDASPTPRVETSRNRRSSSREGGPLDYLYEDPRTPYFDSRVRNDESRHGWLHPLPGSSSSTSVPFQHQRENRANRSGLGFGEQSSSMGELSTPGDSPAQAQLQHHRSSTYSLNDPVSSNSTRLSASSSPRFQNPTSISPVPIMQGRKRPDPDRFVKAIITARPQPHLTSSFSTSSTSPSGSGSIPGQGKRLSRGAGSTSSLGSGSGGKGIALKTMARGPDGQVVVAGNEGAR